MRAARQNGPRVGRREVVRLHHDPMGASPSWMRSVRGSVLQRARQARSGLVAGTGEGRVSAWRVGGREGHPECHSGRCSTFSRGPLLRRDRRMAPRPLARRMARRSPRVDRLLPLPALLLGGQGRGRRRPPQPLARVSTSHRRVSASNGPWRAGCEQGWPTVARPSTKRPGSTGICLRGHRS
jgi:hypothetical protein